MFKSFTCCFGINTFMFSEYVFDIIELIEIKAVKLFKQTFDNQTIKHCSVLPQVYFIRYSSAVSSGGWVSLVKKVLCGALKLLLFFLLVV